MREEEDTTNNSMIGILRVFFSHASCLFSSSIAIHSFSYYDEVCRHFLPLEGFALITFTYFDDKYFLPANDPLTLIPFPLISSLSFFISLKQEKPHKCSLCSKSFPTPGDLKSHMYVHNGSWPFKCSICNRGFSKQTNLRNHMFHHLKKNSAQISSSTA